MPWVRAVPATDTPGPLQSSTSARLAATPYVRRPFTPSQIIKPATMSASFSHIVSTIAGNLMMRVGGVG